MSVKIVAQLGKRKKMGGEAVLNARVCNNNQKREITSVIFVGPLGVVWGLAWSLPDLPSPSHHTSLPSIISMIHLH